MLGLTEPKQNLAGGRTIVELTNSVLPTIAQRAASIDESDTFVGENYALLKNLDSCGQASQSNWAGWARKCPNFLRCSNPLLVHVGPLRLPFPCIPIKSPSPPGAGGIKRWPRWSRS
ncbi:hypothetical protein EV131_10331 [Rhizobium laguerreae]|uniref:Uncharacterized protein n=1 Tax=Rhizobium laguerreae TaxID=1076926 RepID=A0AAX2QQE9_9HYPH|nr:hypothetical protein EV131_10331 [Rhizobium laguerreae]